MNLYNTIYINRLNAVKYEAIKEVRNLVLEYGEEGKYGEHCEGDEEDPDEGMKELGYSYKKIHIPSHFYLRFDDNLGVRFRYIDREEGMPFAKYGTEGISVVKEVRVFDDADQTIHIILHDKDYSTDKYVRLDELSVEEWAKLYAVLGTYIGEKLMKK